VVSFVHATDLHLFEEGDAAIPPAVQDYQARLNRQAFTLLLQRLSSLPDQPPRFLAITGDLGLDPAAGGPTPVARQRHRREQVDVLANLLRASPIPDIYVVAGNNDVESESTADSAVLRTTGVLAEVQEKLSDSPVTIHDLTACYAARGSPPSSCSADVAGTNLRLIGFPSFSFKNGSERAYDANRLKQEAAVAKFAGMVARADSAGKQVVVLTHIPDLDDPYTLAQDRFAGRKPVQTGNTGRPTWSAWNVSPTVFQRWKEIVASRAVVAVLAGHFHDSHREIYYPPYRWSTRSPLRPDPARLFLAPPLAVKLQDASPIQARGFALVTLTNDGIRRRLYWYDAPTSSFIPDAPIGEPASVSPLSAAALWFWNLADALTPLARSVVLAIAFLAAFLTVVAVWKIPPTETRLAAPAPATAAGGATTTPGGAGGGAASSSGSAASSETPFTNNFGRTVITGLGGMLVVTFLDSFWQESGNAAKAYYVVSFVLFFLVLLVASGVFRGVVEGLRSRLVGEPGFTPLPPRSGWRSWSERVRHALNAWLRRLWTWLLSLRPSILVFLDTLFNVVQGKNQLATRALGSTIIDLQASLVRTTDRVREHIDREVRSALRVGPLDENDVRVSISILSLDWSRVFYVSRARGSLRGSFDERSVAWVAVVSGQARWWKETYMEHSAEITLFNNVGGELPRPKQELKLSEYFQARADRDYQAFIILPVPWLRRGLSTGFRRGGIHISFRDWKHLDALCTPEGSLQALGAAADVTRPAYDSWQHLLDPAAQTGGPRIAADGLRVILRQSADVVGEILRRFNDAVFEEMMTCQSAD
jgi:hypothetical protein